MRRAAFVMLYERSNRYSAYSVIAAIESRLRDIDVIPITIDRVHDVIERVRRVSDLYRRIVVGITFRTMQLPTVMNVVRLLKSYAPRVLLVAGGPHATGDPLGTLTKLGFDVVVYGEGEETIVELLQSYIENDEYRVCGTAYLDGGRVIVRKRRRYVDLDKYPPYPSWRGWFCPIEIMRGCRSACYFCQVTYVFGAPRYRSPETVLRLVEEMLRKGLRDARFIAPNSLGYMSSDGIKPRLDILEQFLHDLRKLMDEYGGRIFFGTFPSEVRPDSVDEEVAKVLRRYVHNKRIIVGAQTGSDRLLKAIHRGHTVDDVINAVQILRNAGFEVDVDFIFGLPGENEEDVELSVKVMERLASMGARIHAHTFMPLPGTPFEDAPPGRIHPAIKKFVAKLIGRGRAYGEWLEQERLAELIHEMRMKRLIYGSKEKRMRITYVAC